MFVTLPPSPPAFHTLGALPLRRILLRCSAANSRGLSRKSVRDLLSSSFATTHPSPEALVNGAPDAQTLATAMGPALCDLMTPMSKFVGQVNVWQFGASVQGTRVTVSTQQTIETVTTYATVRAPLCALAPVNSSFSVSRPA